MSVSERSVPSSPLPPLAPKEVRRLVQPGLSCVSKEPSTIERIVRSRCSSRSREPESQASQPQSGNGSTSRAGSPTPSTRPGRAASVRARSTSAPTVASSAAVRARISTSAPGLRGCSTVVRWSRRRGGTAQRRPERRSPVSTSLRTAQPRAVSTCTQASARVHRIRYLPGSRQRLYSSSRLSRSSPSGARCGSSQPGVSAPVRVKACSTSASSCSRWSEKGGPASAHASEPSPAISHSEACSVAHQVDTGTVVMEGQ